MNARRGGARYAKALLTITLALAGAAGSPASEDPARRIAGRFAEACGGLEKIAGLETVSCTATAESYGQQYTLQLHADGRFRIEQATGTVVHDGHDYWQSYHGLVAAVPPGGDRERYERISLSEAFFHGLLAGREIAPGLRHAGSETVRGRPCELLEGTTPGGARRTWYLDAETGLLTKHIDIASDPELGERKTIFAVDDYQDVGGLRLSCRLHGICITTNEEVQPLTQFSDVRVNEPLDAALFARPEPTAPPVRREGGTLVGQVLALSGGGSLITNVTAEDLAGLGVPEGATLAAEVKRHTTRHLFHTEIETFTQIGSGDYIATFNHTPALWLVKAYAGMRSDDSTYAPGDEVRLAIASGAEAGAGE